MAGSCSSRRESGELAAATLRDSDTRLQVASLEVLFSLEGFGTEDETSTHYDVDAGDERFAMLRLLQAGRQIPAGSRQIIIVDNLERLFERAGEPATPAAS